MPVDNELHKAAHKGDLEACKMLIESSVGEDTPMILEHPIGDHCTEQLALAIWLYASIFCH